MAIHIELDVTFISLVFVLLGAYVCVIGQLSFFIKEKLYVSSALIAICVGIGFGPHGAGWIAPSVWTGSEESTRDLTFQLMRTVVGIQVCFAGIDLPAAYLLRHWRSLLTMLGPIMLIAWFVSAGLIKALFPRLTFLETLCISACVTPTDPVLANSIVKGRYAEKHVDPEVRDIISAESGANDGLGFPFIFIPLLLFNRKEGESLGTIVGKWLVETVIYQILMAVVLGAVIGWAAQKTLYETYKRRLVDDESFLAFGVGLSLLVLGVVGTLGSDDVLAAFIAGNALTWKDFFRIETEEDHTQSVIDNLLNTSVFIYIGALIPWDVYSNADVGMSPWRVVVLGIAIMALRRLPWVILLRKGIPAVTTRSEAFFCGWFGPIGVSSVYYITLAQARIPEERETLHALIAPIVLFIAFTSTVCHGITIPIAHHGPKLLSRTGTSEAFIAGLDRLNISRGGSRSQSRASSIRRVDLSSISGPIPFPPLGAVEEERGRSGKETPPLGGTETMDEAPESPRKRQPLAERNGLPRTLSQRQVEFVD